MAGASTIFYSSDSLFALSSAEIPLHFPWGWEFFHVSCELCPPSSPAGCCHRDFVFPYHSLPCHLSRFSVMSRFKTAVVFFTFDCPLLLGEKREEDGDTRCMVSESKETGASDGSTQ